MLTDYINNKFYQNFVRIYQEFKTKKMNLFEIEIFKLKKSQLTFTIFNKIFCWAHRCLRYAGLEFRPMEKDDDDQFL